MTEPIKTDVLIIGCGIAGSVAALELADAGIETTVVTRAADPAESNTYYAQGGIIYKGDGDTPELLVQDILRAGAGHSNPYTTRILAEEGPDLVERILINRLNIPFDRKSSGDYESFREGSHSMPRILHYQDQTGKAIQEALVKALKEHPNIRLLHNYTAIDLLTPSHHSTNRLRVYEPLVCNGAYLFDQRRMKVVTYLAKKTILATGGLGQIYMLTSNPAGARGDGLAMAYRAGARIINSEFVQFHPTVFRYKQAPNFLISEAVRGAGARLINEKGEPFMERYAPEWKDLAPRDVVARSIHQEMLARDLPNVYLDMASYISKEDIIHRFPTIYENCIKNGIDPTSEPVPVVPAAHYFCGGIWVDEWGHSTIRNLYAVGEVACTGVHGANRLASASLLEGVVWGARSAQRIQNYLPKVEMPRQDEFPEWIDTGIETPDPALITQDMSFIRSIMWNYVGLMRTTPRLARALRDLRNLESEIEQFYRKSRLSDNLIGLRNAIRSAILVTLAAWENKRSMGCHFRVS
ncbi:MAG: L-aspartate oxidase [Calditrichia bacterium]